MKKIIKRTLFVVALLMLLCISAVAEDISAYGLTSSDNRIKIFTEYIGAFSFGESLVSSEDIRNSVASSGGWTVEGWSETEGGTAEDTSDVSGGYVILTKGTQNAYVPVKCSTGVTEIKADGAEQNMVGGYAATSQNKLSYVIGVGEAALKAFGGVELTQEKTEYTYALNFYADGNSTMEVYFRKNDMDMCKLLEWLPNGTFNMYTSADSVNATLSITENLARGQWHRMVLMHDLNRGRFHIYIDGEFKGNSFGGMWGSTVNRLYIGAGKGSTNGSVALGNIRGCYKMVKEDYENISLSSVGDALTIADNVISVDVSTVENVEDVIAHLSTNAANVRAYKDSSFSEIADKVTDTTVLVLSNASETAFRYYKLIPARIEVSNASFCRDGGMIYASAEAKYNSQNSKLLTAVLVIKDTDGRVTKLITSPTAEVSSTVCPFSVSSEISDTEHAEMFFIDNWTSRLGYEYKIFKEAK